MKDKLFSVIGHDLRGPVARMLVILDMVEDETTSPEERKMLMDNLREHTRISLETFDKLLFWGRSLVSGGNTSRQNMLTKEYIKEGIELRRIKAAEKNITITDKTPNDLTVYSNPSIFDFIMRNLVANALKYTPRNGRIDISADISGKNGFTIFAVRDSGIGINKELIPGIFSALKSLEGTENEQGHGIGLMLCKEFAQQNGGDIWVESEEGKGATFYFSVKNQSV
jgi:signal transduction histidine kinase